MSGFPGKRTFLAVVLIGLFCLRVPISANAQSFLGLSAGTARHDGFWEGKTDYGFALRPAGRIRAIMLFAHFPDTKVEEAPGDLYARLAPGGIAFFARASYGKVKLEIDSLPHWIPMEHPSTWPDYSAKRFESQKNYLDEIIRKAAKEIDFTSYDIVYVVGSQSPGMPNSPTFGAAEGDGIVIHGKEIRHAVTFGNDCRIDRWGWQTLCHETGHIFGLPDLYSFDFSGPYKNIQKYVGFWDLMGYQALGSEYLAWQKRKLEWLADSDFVLVPNGSADAVIAPIYNKEGKKAVVVPISATEAYVAEVRSQDGQPESETGVLLYRIDLAAKREGHIRVIPAAPDDNDPTKERRFVTLYNALYHAGLVLDDKDAHIRIEILGRAGKSFHLRVTR
ncbi:MAG: family metalloprotease protein [Chthonomonadaceae bacterium]|nr:family metalloprotease protein [Chthonomonadaceae bacterium]